MKRFVTGIAFVCFAIALSASAMQDPQGPGGGSRGGEHRRPPSVDDQLTRLDKELSLTDAQKPQVKSALEDQHKQMDALMQDSSLSREDRMAKMKEIHESSSGKIREALNDDQKKKFDQLQEKQKEHMGHGMGPHGHGGASKD